MKRLASSKHCFVCGVENEAGLKLALYSEREGHVTGRFVIPEKFQGWPGIAHGGVLAAILDEAAGRTADAEAIPTNFYVTGSLSVKYRHPVKCGIPLIVEAELVKRKGRVVIGKSWIMDESKLVLAEANITYVQVDSNIVKDHSDSADEWVLDQDQENSDD